MASSNPTRPSLYPPVLLSNPDSYSAGGGGGASLYPTVDASDLAAEQLFPDDGGGASSAASAPPECLEEVVLTIPGAIVNLIDRDYSVELAAGGFSIVRLRQGGTVLALFARVGDNVQWPLAKDGAAVKLDDSHYFFSLRVPPAAARGSPDSSDDDSPSPAAGAGDVLNYGLTFASKGQEKLLRELDAVLEAHSSFSVQKVADGAAASGEVLDASVARGVSPVEMASGAKREMMEKQSAAYWTTLAPNVEEYSGYVAKGIALGSGQLIRGIIWCGDVTVDRLKWGNEVLKKRIDPNAKNSEISPNTIKRMKRVKRVTKMSEKVANGVLSGVVKVTGFFTSSIANSKVGKKFFSLLPGEIVLASLDGFGRVSDAVEVAGKNVLSTSSTVTTDLVSQRYGEEAAELTNESFSAAGHALGTAWAVSKIRKGLNPKSVLKPSSLAKSAVKAAAADAKSQRGK